VTGKQVPVRQSTEPSPVKRLSGGAPGLVPGVKVPKTNTPVLPPITGSIDPLRDSLRLAGPDEPAGPEIVTGIVNSACPKAVIPPNSVSAGALALALAPKTPRSTLASALPVGPTDGPVMDTETGGGNRSELTTPIGQSPQLSSTPAS